MLRRTGLLVLATLVSSCGPLVFTCQDDGMCDRAPGGVCEDNAQCSYADEACPGGQRFPDDVPGVGGECVGAGSGTTASTDSAEASGSGESTGHAPDECGLAGNACCQTGSACEPGLQCLTAVCTCHDRIVSGRRHGCVIDFDGQTRCWGDNARGQIQFGGPGTFATPTPIDFGVGERPPFAAWEHTCLVGDDATVTCFGRNESGQAVPSGADPAPPTSVGGASARAVAVGPAHSCAVLGSEIRCWGADADERLGGTPGPGPITVQTPAAVVDATLALGDAHSCALAETAGGTSVWCWGDDTDGQLGDGASGGATATPSTVDVPTPFAIVAGARHTCTATETEVRCWGANDRGQLGRSGAGSATPQPVPGVADDNPFVGLTAGANHTCAWSEGGAAICWGDNTAGQIDAASAESELPPTGVATNLGLNPNPRLRALSAGESHTCALTSADQLACWGRNDDGQLAGTGTGDGQVAVTDLGC